MRWNVPMSTMEDTIGRYQLSIFIDYSLCLAVSSCYELSLNLLDYILVALI